MTDRITPVEERLAEPPPPRQQETDERLNAVIAGQYRIEEKIGDGGMGTVYKCTDLAVNRIVAVKILHPHLIATSKWFLRFQQEAKAIARLQHPNIINMHHFSPADDAPFIVMDYVSGWALSDILSHGGKLSIERTLRIISQVADALSHAHANGVVHRDLKPSNIMILDLTNDEIKILDFGIAQITDEKANLTQTGEVFGSPAYMSPEQCEGKKIDARSDQYSLGCVLFECLTGTPPFAATSSIQVMMHQINEAPPTLKEASLGQAFPENLEYIVKKLLAKNPADRFADMDEAIRTLRGRPIATAKPEAQAAQKPWLAGTKLWIVLLGTVAFLSVLVYFLFESLKPEPKPAPAVVQVTPQQEASLLRDLGTNEKLDANKLFLQLVNTNPNAHSIKPPRPSISDEVLESLSNMPNLEGLELSDCVELTDEGMKILAADNLKNLSSLGLRKVKVTDEGCKYLATLNSLKSIQLSGTSITDQGVRKLQHLPLTSLNISYNDDLSGEALQSIPKFTELKHLKINCDKNIVTGIKYLLNTKLTDLNLSSTATTDEEVIAFLAKIKTLDKLELNKTEISDAAIRALSALNLTQLDVGSTAITEKSIPYLMAMHNLSQLNVSECPSLSPQALERLRKALPGCNVIDVDEK